MNATDTAKQLSAKLDERLHVLDKFDRYYDGKMPLSFLAPEIAAATEGRLQPLTVPWPRVVVSAVEERCNIEGFRVEQSIDQGLWTIWQDNNLDEFSQFAHEDALIHGRAFVLVWADEAGQPRITVESAKQCYVQHTPGSRRRLRGIKRWAEDGYGHLVLFEPRKVSRFRSQGRIVQDNPDLTSVNWGEPVSSMNNPLGVVPLIPLVNKGRTLTPDGESELGDLLPMFDALSKLATDMMVGAEFHAMPRRYAIGIELPEKRDEQGQPTGEVDADEAFDAMAGRTWMSESTETKFGEFPGADLGGFVNAITSLTEALAAAANLPGHYLGITTANPASADAIRSSEAGLVSKARRKMRSWGGSWEEAMRLAVAIRDGRFDPRLNKLETVWGDPETRTVAMAADAAVKLHQAGIIPADFAAEMAGYTPTQIERMRQMRRRDALDQAASTFIQGRAS